MAEISFQDIRARAYELWERHHRPDGFEVQLWLMAERELKAERDRTAAGPSPAPSQAPDAAERSDGG